MEAQDADRPHPAAAAGAEIATRFVTANGLRFELQESGAGDRLVLFLHGFPENAAMWQDLLPLVAARGWRAWAPNQRGYGASARPPGVFAYDLDRLIEDVAGLIDASGARSTVLVGHDWGAMVAWCFAIRRPRPLAGLVILSVPHPARYLWCLLRPSHLVRSLYVLIFSLPVLPDWLFASRGGRLVASLMRLTSVAPACFTASLLAAYCRNIALPGAATAMLNWYRASVLGGLLRQALRGFPVIEVPTLMVWGDRDPVLRPLLLPQTDRYVAQLAIHHLPQAGHWVVQEDAEGVAAALGDFLDGLP
jgi:pimeloyl-ACP methyl ester carboxylesterase